jgi:DNA-binding NtrC family response regulator
MNASKLAIGVVDDDRVIRDSITGLIEAEGWQAHAFFCARDLLHRGGLGGFGCLILDVDLPDMGGLELQRQILRISPHTPVIFLTAHGDIPMSVEAIKAGACEFFTKPFRPEDLIEAIRHILPPAQIGEGNASGLVGHSAALREIERQVDLVAGGDTTVLITGESGTGKELIARAIHERSPRRLNRLVCVNCGAIPEALFESELFGHTRGAFTGAVRDTPGRFELADGGTLFLDEIGEMPLPMQTKLLRFLQEKEIDRVGDRRPRKLQVRVVAATNRDLDAEVAAGRFRQDLFYRLNVFPIECPPLRKRREDILPLTQHFLHAIARRLKKPGLQISPAAAQQLIAHDWPGNIRELQNVIERSVIVSRGRQLQLTLPAPRACATDPGSETTGIPPPILTRGELRQREKESIAFALASAGGRVSGPRGAAALLGMKPTTLYSRITALGIRQPANAP